MENELVRSAGSLLQNSKKILIVSHIRPDGDAISAVLGLGTALKNAGKQVQMVLKDSVLPAFQYLPEWKNIERKVKGDFDLSIALDCADFDRTGGVLKERSFDLNIDHHITNQNFARLNFVDPSAVATSAILAEWLGCWGLQITQTVAELLLNGIIVDTIGFRTSNMTSKALRLAADLMDYGVDLPALYANALMRRSFSAARYWGHGLANLHREDRIIWTTLSLSQRNDAEYPGTDDADLTNILSSIDDCDISLLFIEQKHNRVKVSWRAQNGYDVSKLALSFGGGGHPAAAGAEISGTMEEVKDKVLTATKNFLKQNPDKQTLSNRKILNPGS